MPAPTITALPPAPLRSQTPAVFTATAETFVEALEDLPTEINAFGVYINSLGLDPDDTLTAEDVRDIIGTALVAGTGVTITVNDGGDTITIAAAGASTTQTQEMIAGFIAAPADKSYTIALKMAHAGTITETTTKSASGTCTATFKVNATALGGTANSVSSSEQSQAHSGTNTFVAGDDIVLTVSANSACADMSFAIKYTRVLE